MTDCANCPHDISEHGDRAVLPCGGNLPRSEHTETEDGVIKREVWDGGERPEACP